MNEAAYYAVHQAVKTGALVKPNACEGCTRVIRVEAHHHMGYESEHWLTVQWLCRRCHKRVHLDLEASRRGQRKGVQTRLKKYTPAERAEHGRRAWATRLLRLTPEEYAAQMIAQANKRRGAKRTPEARQRMSDAHKGQVPWNKGLRNE